MAMRKQRPCRNVVCDEMVEGWGAVMRGGLCACCYSAFELGLRRGVTLATIVGVGIGVVTSLIAYLTR